MSTLIPLQPGLPPHKYAGHVSTVLRFSRMHRDPAWREAVGLSVPSRTRLFMRDFVDAIIPALFAALIGALALAALLVSPAFLYCCFYL